MIRFEKHPAFGVQLAFLFFFFIFNFSCSIVSNISRQLKSNANSYAACIYYKVLEEDWLHLTEHVTFLKPRNIRRSMNFMQFWNFDQRMSRLLTLWNIRPGDWVRRGQYVLCTNLQAYLFSLIFDWTNLLIFTECAESSIPTSRLFFPHFVWLFPIGGLNLLGWKEGQRTRADLAFHLQCYIDGLRLFSD